MPSANASSQRPHRGSSHDDPHESWSLPVGQLGPTRIEIAYSVFVALALLVGFVTMVSGLPGNQDLPLVALMGVGFWFAGWLLQVFATLWTCGRLRMQCPSLTIGLWGVETKRRDWTCSQCLVIVVNVLMTMTALVLAFLLVECWMVGSRGEASQLFVRLARVWEAPGFGLTQTESVFLSGAWLCLIQMICQLIPFPATMGRMGLVASVALVNHGASSRVQVRRARQSIRVVALMLAIVSIALVYSEDTAWSVQWPLVMLLAVALWFTAKFSDVPKYVLGFNGPTDQQIIRWLESDETGDSELAEAGSGTRSGLLTRLKNSVRSWRNRRKALQALKREHAEADDAMRLDVVLDQLHREGFQSLSDQDRALLMRVSETIRSTRHTVQNDPKRASSADEEAVL